MEQLKIIEGCADGELWAMKKLYEQNASEMMSVCMRYAGNIETARDLLHDGFIKLFANIHTYSGSGSFNGWMRRVFVTTALEHLRRKDVLRHSVEIEMLDYSENEHDISYFEHLSADDLLDCVANLPEKYRTVFNMFAIEGYKHEEIANELEISVIASRTRYLKARRLLQKMVSG